MRVNQAILFSKMFSFCVYFVRPTLLYVNATVQLEFICKRLLRNWRNSCAAFARGSIPCARMRYRQTSFATYADYCILVNAFCSGTNFYTLPCIHVRTYVSLAENSDQIYVQCIHIKGEIYKTNFIFD